MANSITSKTFFQMLDLTNRYGKQGDILHKSKKFAEWEDSRKKLLIHTYRRVLLTPPDRKVIAKDVLDSDRPKEFLYFGSNNYLNLSTEERVKEGAIAAIRKWGTSSGASSSIGGETSFHSEIQEKIAKFFGYEAAFVYSSGYFANEAVLLSLLRPGDIVISDHLSHRSIDNACKAAMALSRGKITHTRYKHNDFASLENILEKLNGDNLGRMLITDGVFSMDGTLANLSKLRDISHSNNMILIVDDAHGIGVLGEHGRGTCERLNVTADLLTGSFAKSFGSMGGFVAGPKDVIAFLEATSNGSLFSSYIPVGSMGAISTALDIIQNEPERRKCLLENADYLKKGLQMIGIETTSSITPIIPTIFPDEDEFWFFAYYLHQHGIYTNPILPPAVLHTRFRLSVTSKHQREDFDKTIEIFERGKKEYLKKYKDKGKSFLY